MEASPSDDVRVCSAPLLIGTAEAVVVLVEFEDAVELPLAAVAAVAAVLPAEA
jgi:hypothetical protein